MTCCGHLAMYMPWWSGQCAALDANNRGKTVAGGCRVGVPFHGCPWWCLLACLGSQRLLPAATRVRVKCAGDTNQNVASRDCGFGFVYYSKVVRNQRQLIWIRGSRWKFSVFGQYSAASAAPGGRSHRFSCPHTPYTWPTTRFGRSSQASSLPILYRKTRTNSNSSYNSETKQDTAQESGYLWN